MKFLARSLFLILNSSFLILSLSARAQIQQAWVAKYNNGITNGQHQALKMSLDSSGNVLVTGFSQNTNGGTGYATLKYASTGNPFWTARLDSTNAAQAQPAGLALDASNAAAITGNAGSVKYDAFGNVLWRAGDTGTAIAADQSGNNYVTGVGTNFNTVKIGPGGTNLWSATYTDVGPSIGLAISVDQNGETYVAGSDDYYYFFDNFVWRYYNAALTVKFSSAGSPLWHERVESFASYPAQIGGLMLDANGNAYLVFWILGQTFAPSEYASSNGATVWSAGNPSRNVASMAHGLVLDSQNNIYITGQFASSPCAYATYKISTNGTYLWTNCYPFTPTPMGAQTTINVATSIALDSKANSYITGYSPDANGTNDIVTIAYDTNGKQLWLQRYIGLGYGAAGNAIACDNNGNVYVAGYENVPGGGTEMVLIKYSPVALRRQSNGNFLLQAQGSPGEAFDIQASTNLESWSDLGTQDADTNGLLQYLDTNAPLFPFRFYLAVPQL